MSQQTIRILLVDDHDMVRIGLRTILNKSPEIEVIGEANSVSTAIEATQSLHPDMVLMDILLPDGKGYEACRAIKSQSKDIKVIMLTAMADREFVSESLQAEADGFILKEISSEKLISSIKQVAKGVTYLDPAITPDVISIIREKPGESPKERLALLAKQERRVLALVAEGKTNKEIAVDMGLSDKTVKNYFSNTLDKLKLNRRSQAAAFFVRHTS
jgi:DNA-binding NarL/FixJ family response regulator